jgi:thymidylate synthase
MKVFSEYTNFSSNYLVALKYVLDQKDDQTIKKSRVGNVYDLGPCCFEFCAKDLPVTILSQRFFNPFFAIAEAAWILEGSNALRPLEYFIRSYKKFSDDGKTLNGAYGFRARQHFKIDQINEIISLLNDDPETRRAVLTLYSPKDLCNNISKDIPCNTSVFFKIRNNKLDMTVINRSNDLYLGIPYNVFVFNILLKYISIKINVEVGVQRHFSDSLHLYTNDFDSVKTIVSGNSFDKVDDQLSSFTQLDDDFVSGMINNRKEILNLNFNEISHTILRNLFLQYESYKNKLDITPSDTNDIIEYSVKQWLKKYNK